MGALASAGQLKDVREQIGKLHKQARIVSGNPDHVFPGHEKGAFMEPVLLRTDTPWTADAVHDVEAFGPVSTIMPYKDLDDAIALANRGMGSRSEEHTSELKLLMRISYAVFCLKKKI